MTKSVSVDTKSTQEKEKDKEYEAMCDRVHTFKLFESVCKKIKETKEHDEEYNITEKIIRNGEYSETKEKYTLGVRVKFDVNFQYFEISKHPNFEDECIYASREFFFRKNLITDDEKKEIEKFEQKILNRFYYSK